MDRDGHTDQVAPTLIANREFISSVGLSPSRRSRRRKTPHRASSPRKTRAGSTATKTFLLDTNVLLRVFVEDHAEQVAAVRKLLKGAEASSFFISDIVLVELVWTLRRSFKATRARIVEAIEGLLASNVFVLEHRDDVIPSFAEQ